MPKEEEEKLMKKPEAGSIQRQEMPKEEEEKLMKKGMTQITDANEGWTAAPELENSIQQARGGGHALSDGIRKQIEHVLGTDFRGVKVHTDTHSDMLNRSVQARAFTMGKDIFFKQGEYNPGSSAGQELIAHELTHVMQQNRDVGSKHKQEGELLQTKKITGHNAELPPQVNHVSKPVIQAAYIGTRPLDMFGGSVVSFLSGGLVEHWHIFFEDGGAPANVGFHSGGLFVETNPGLIGRYTRQPGAYNDDEMRKAYQAVAPGTYNAATNNCQHWVGKVLARYNQDKKVK